MPFRLRQITLADLSRGKAQEPLQDADHWSVYAPCTGDEPDDCLIYQQLIQLKSKKDKKSAYSALVKLVGVAAMGDPLEAHYDKKQCHELFDFQYRGKRRVVWRIRNGAVRIPFYYAEGKLIFLAGLVVKRRDKLRPKEEAEVKKQVEHLIDAQAEDVIELTSPSASVSQTRGNK